MPYVVTFENVTPSARYDGLPWTSVRIEEAATFSGTFSLIETKALSPVDADPSAPSTRNFTTDDATLEKGYYRLGFVDSAARLQYTDVISRIGELVTMAEFLAALGEAPGDVDTTTETRYAQSIQAASSAVCDYVDTDFTAPPVTEQRTFEYDGSGFLDIDVAAAITAVAFSYGGIDSVIAASEWRASPLGANVLTYVVLPGLEGGMSAEMGFTRNLDTIYRERGWSGLGGLIKVDATWGWAFVPESVKQATIITAMSFAEKPNAYQAESIANYSRSQGPLGSGLALPEKAKELLAPYLRYKVG